MRAWPPVFGILPSKVPNQAAIDLGRQEMSEENPRRGEKSRKKRDEAIFARNSMI